MRNRLPGQENFCTPADGLTPALMASLPSLARDEALTPQPVRSLPSVCLVEVGFLSLCLLDTKCRLLTFRVEPWPSPGPPLGLVCRVLRGLRQMPRAHFG